MGDSVLLPQIRNLRNVADYRKKQLRLKNALRTGVTVDDEANTSAKIAAEQIKQNILPMMPNEDLIAASREDKTKQYNTALGHLKSIMTGDDATYVLRSGFQDLEQLQELNQYWTLLLKYLGGAKNITPQYFFQYWHRLRQVLQATDDTGVFIPFQRKDAEDFFGGPGGVGGRPPGASGPSSGGPGGNGGDDGGDDGYGDGGGSSFPGTPGSSVYGSQYEYERPDYTLSAYRRLDPSSSSSDPFISSSNSPPSTISSISSNSRTRSFASSALSSAYNEANTPEANFTPVGSFGLGSLDDRVQALIDGDGDIGALSSVASSDNTLLTPTTPNSRLFNLYRTHMTNLNLPRRRFAFEEEENPFVSNAANDVLPAAPPTFGETPDVYDDQLFFRRNRLLPAVPGYSTGDPYEALETAMSSTSNVVPTSNNVILPSASNFVAPRRLANIGVPGNEEAKEAKEISVDDWWREYYQTFPTGGTYAEMIQWLDNSRTMLRQRRDYEDNFEIPPDDIAQEIETALEKVKRKAPTFGETSDVYDGQLFSRRSPKAAPSSSSSKSSLSKPSPKTSAPTPAPKSPANFVAVALAKRRAQIQPSPASSSSSSLSSFATPKSKRGGRQRAQLAPTGTKSKVQTERTPPASNPGTKKKSRVASLPSSSASAAMSLDGASQSRGSMQGSQASSKSSKKDMSDSAVAQKRLASKPASESSSIMQEDIDVEKAKIDELRHYLERNYGDKDDVREALDKKRPKSRKAVLQALVRKYRDGQPLRRSTRVSKKPKQFNPSTGKDYDSTGGKIRKNIRFGAGISAPDEPRYDRFGCYLIHMPSLSKNRLNIKFPSLASHPKIPQRIISEELATLLRKILETGQMNAPLYAALSASDKEYFDNLAHMCKIGGKLGIAPRESNADMQRFQVVRGEILSGNDAPQLIKELKHLTLKLVTEGKIPKRSAHDLLIEISLL